MEDPQTASGSRLVPPNHRRLSWIAAACGQPAEDVSDLADRPISRIDIVGLQRVDEQLVRNHLRTAAGDPYDPDTVRADVKLLTRLGEFSHVDAEAELIESEARTVIDAIIDLPGKLFWQSVYRAFQLGIIDIPFAPHADNANRLISMRDAIGSIRISDPGSVPLGKQDLKLERRLLDERGPESGKTYQQLLSDINIMA